jgi:hypothetical protein
MTLPDGRVILQHTRTSFADFMTAAQAPGTVLRPQLRRGESQYASCPVPGERPAAYVGAGEAWPNVGMIPPGTAILQYNLWSEVGRRR